MKRIMPKKQTERSFNHPLSFDLLLVALGIITVMRKFYGVIQYFDVSTLECGKYRRLRF